jgi:hypothetical protein
VLKGLKQLTTMLSHELLRNGKKHVETGSQQIATVLLVANMNLVDVLGKELEARRFVFGILINELLFVWHLGVGVGLGYGRRARQGGIKALSGNTFEVVDATGDGQAALKQLVKRTDDRCLYHTIKSTHPTCSKQTFVERAMMRRPNTRTHREKRSGRSRGRRRLQNSTRLMQI